MTTALIDEAFTQKNWWNFEVLTGILFQLEFGLNKNEIIITQMSGEDGKNFQIQRNYACKILEHPRIEIWVEAKLKGTKTDVHIKDISGTVIIASNSKVSAVYFVTNCFFTSPTIEQLLLFRDKSGLQITLVDGYQYRNLLTEHFTKVLALATSGGTDNYGDFRTFMEQLLSSLPEEPCKANSHFDLLIKQGKIYPGTRYSNAIKEDSKIELRKVDHASISKSSKSFKLNDIKLVPAVDDEEINQNLSLQLIGKERNEMLSEVLHSLIKNEIVIVKGNSGQGKTFFANHVARSMYKQGYTVLFADLFENNTISFTKEIITNLIGLDYFKFLEEDEGVISYLSEYFKIERAAGTKILELMRKDKFTDTIPVEICLEILVHLVTNHAGRKKIVLVVDNLHKASTDLLAFAKNLFIRLCKASVPALAFTVYQSSDQQMLPENLWLQYLDSITVSNKFSTYTLTSLSEEDIQAYIKTLLPGANTNLVNLVSANTLKDPFFIKLYVEFLKQKEIVRSIDGKYWWLDDSSMLLDSTQARSNNIDSIISELLSHKLRTKAVKDIGLALFFFNNRILASELEQILGEIDLYEIVSFDLFRTELSGEAIAVTFSHDLFYYNFITQFREQEVQLFALKILSGKDIQISREDVLAKLYEFAGNLNRSYSLYASFAAAQYRVSPFKSMLFYEKALDVKLSLPQPTQSESGISTISIVFKILELYERYNFLSSRKSPGLFSLLKKHEDFAELSQQEKLQHYYFLGTRFTKEEEFNTARVHFRNAYDFILNSENIPQRWIDKIINCIGMNLKHIGEKEQSLRFFEEAVSKWNSPSIKYEQYANTGAYYLTSKPQLALECLNKMKAEFPDNGSVHLIVDFAMAHFYLGNIGESITYLNEALPLSRKKINLAEEARAENIFGIINWQRQNLETAEAYLDLALSNGELANNHRWIWRIRANLAQVSVQNQHCDKAYNTCWALITHLLKTKNALAFEARQPAINSRRFAALKAVANVFYHLNKEGDLEKATSLFNIPEFSAFVKHLQAMGNVSFDADTNRFGNDYFILG